MPTLEQGPPPPPGIGASPQPSMGQMAGPQPAGPGPATGLTQAVLEKMMLAEKAMEDAATIMPALAPVIQDLTQQFRSRVGAIVLQAQQGSDQAPSSGISALLGGSGPSAPATS